MFAATYSSLQYYLRGIYICMLSPAKSTIAEINDFLASPVAGAHTIIPAVEHPAKLQAARQRHWSKWGLCPHGMLGVEGGQHKIPLLQPSTVCQGTVNLSCLRLNLINRVHNMNECRRIQCLCPHWSVSSSGGAIARPASAQNVSDLITLNGSGPFKVQNNLIYLCHSLEERWEAFNTYV